MVVSATDDTAVARVIICGGGVIGTAVSYYLAKKGVQTTVVDKCGLAAAASGRAGVLSCHNLDRQKRNELYSANTCPDSTQVRQHSIFAGGFLALDWNDASRLGPLARLSYKLHAGLEEELGMALDYRHALAPSPLQSCKHCVTARVQHRSH